MRRLIWVALLALLTATTATARDEISNPGVDCTIQNGITNGCTPAVPVLICDTACTQLIEDTTSAVLIESN